ncbi:MAG: hypothetical protein KF819_00550 [Labilithrix sp.]|nr:hypothetical protein [Labilithrix sp.]
MAAEDELVLPQVPEAKPEDPEDVSWALSTAEAMWARGDHLEGIKWVRKAAEAASDVEDDMRALELAKAASELAGIVARRSMASIGEGAPPAEAPSQRPAAEGWAPPPTSAQPVSVMPSTARSVAPVPPGGTGPPPPVAAGPASARPPAPAKARSAPPIPLPSKASQPPPPNTPLGHKEAPRPPAAPRTPLGKPVAASRVAADPPRSGKGKRRSRENLEAEAAAAGVADTAPQRAVDADRLPLGDATTRSRRRSRPDGDATVIATLAELTAAGERERSAAEWDASPTQNLTGDDMDHMTSDGDRKTTAIAVPHVVNAAPAQAPVRAPTQTVHDPEIQTSQAVRVVVWRDANGVHVAPEGTVVSSITIEAVLVVLEPGVDLTAWLSQR